MMQQQLGIYQRSKWLDSDEMSDEMARLARDGWFVHTMTTMEMHYQAVVDVVFVIYRKED